MAKVTEALNQFQSTLPVWGATGFIGLWSPVTLFQSTLPVWGATGKLLDIHQNTLHFNPRSPCGERPENTDIFFVISDISIHAPRVGSDLQRAAPRSVRINFNPRSPCGERP